MQCKFCGKEISGEKYIHQEPRSCGECTAYCMKKCELGKAGRVSWHAEPCTSCEKNPYNWRGEKQNGI